MTVFEKAKQLQTRREYVDTRRIAGKMTDETLSSLAEYILSDECVRDLERLENGDYYLDPPHYREVPKNFSKRKRAVYYFSGTQSYIVKLLMFALRDQEKKYSDHLYSFRSDIGAKEFLTRLKHTDLNRYYILKTDVSNYVGSIVPELILPMLKERYFPDDPAFFSFLEWLLMRKKVIDRGGEIIDHTPGGLGGVPLGNFFMNVYLQEMDDYYGPRCPLYYRYSDDVLIAAETYEEILAYREKFFSILEHLHLGCNKDKTMVIMPGEPVEILGMQVHDGKMGISDFSMMKIKRKVRRRARRLNKKCSSGEITREEAAVIFIQFINRFFYGVQGQNLLNWARWAFPVLSDTSCLKEIDHYIQDTLRRLLYGSKQQRRMSIPYSRLQELGYHPLLTAFHHPDLIQKIRRDNLAILNAYRAKRNQTADQ